MTWNYLRVNKLPELPAWSLPLFQLTGQPSRRIYLPEAAAKLERCFVAHILPRLWWFWLEWIVAVWCSISLIVR